MPVRGNAKVNSAKRMQTRIRDLSLEVAIALAIVGAILYAAGHSPPDHKADFRWIGLVGMTAITFGYPLRWYRRHWGRLPFWFVWGGLLAAHVATYVVVLLTVRHFGYMWFAIIGPLEWAVICPLLERAARSSVGASLK